jgi:hypothetical protein
MRELLSKSISLKISEGDYKWLMDVAIKEDRAVGAVARMAIKRLRQENKYPLHSEGTE